MLLLTFSSSLLSPLLLQLRMSNPIENDRWKAADYNTKASFVYSDWTTRPVLDLLAAQPGVSLCQRSLLTPLPVVLVLVFNLRLPQESILDLGCGSGELTLALGTTVGPAGRIVGVDASADLLAAAEKLKGGDDSVKFLHVDGHDVGKLEERFDAVFSNAALHWMKKDPAQVVRGVFKVLKSGGRFVAEVRNDRSWAWQKTLG